MARVLLRRGSTTPAGGGAGADGPFAFPIAAPATVRTRRILLFGLLGLVTYGLSLAATAPARLLLGEGGPFQTVSGTIWAGEAAMAEGHALRWTWSPLGTLFKLGLAADVRVDGPDTDLRGEALVRPGSWALTELEGAADGSLLRALFPSLPFSCGVSLRADVARLAAGGNAPGADGTLRTTAGACSLAGAAPGFGTELPALVATSSIDVSGSAGWLAPAGERGRRLVTWTMTPENRLSVQITPAGAALLPGGGAGLPREFNHHF